MCEAIVKLNSDTSAWETASQRSREYMDNRFNLTRMTAPYVEAVSDLMGGPPAAERVDHA
jgi:hypothetical protein